MIDKRKPHLIVIDPTAFPGGSKVATENILRLLDSERFNITVLTADTSSWHLPQFRRVHLYQPKWLARQEQGIRYFLLHIVIAVNLILTRLRFGKVDLAIGASGPGVDLALYLVKSLLAFNIIQLVHGPVACSRTIARCLIRADEVHYLESSRDSLIATLSRITGQPQDIMSANFHIMQNGLPQYAWPSTCQTLYPAIFWAASLLKWKGLETLLTALHKIKPSIRPATHICYIKPQQTQLSISQAPIQLEHVYWYDNPVNLDQIRSSTNIFVSTSCNEPFGLSILEAMAAGLCILIPADGSYWDRTLKHNVDCIKYCPSDTSELKNKLVMLSQNMQQVAEIGRRAAVIALNYQAEKQYANIKKSILILSKNPATANICRGHIHD